MRAGRGSILPARIIAENELAARWLKMARRAVANRVDCAELDYLTITVERFLSTLARMMVEVIRTTRLKMPGQTNVTAPNPKVTAARNIAPSKGIDQQMIPPISNKMPGKIYPEIIQPMPKMPKRPGMTLE